MASVGNLILRYRNMFITEYSTYDSHIGNGLGQILMSQIATWIEHDTLDLITMRMTDLYIKLYCLKNTNYQQSIKNELKKVLPVHDVIDIISDFSACPDHENYRKTKENKQKCYIDEMIENEWYYNYNDNLQNIPLYESCKLYDAAIHDLSVIYGWYNDADYVYIINFDNYTFYILHGVIRDLKISINRDNIDIFQNIPFVERLLNHQFNVNDHKKNDFMEIQSKLQINTLHPIQHHLSMKEIRKIGMLYQFLNETTSSKKNKNKETIIKAINDKIKQFHFLFFADPVQIYIDSPWKTSINIPISREFDLSKNYKYIERYQDVPYFALKMQLDFMQQIQEFIDDHQ